MESVYPQSYWPGEGTGDHLEFALKYDGVNLGLLSTLFNVAPTDEIVAWIRSKPTGKYARRVWFLYEFLTASSIFLSNSVCKTIVVIRRRRENRISRF